jgi:hypothetical protein
MQNSALSCDGRDFDNPALAYLAGVVVGSLAVYWLSGI